MVVVVGVVVVVGGTDGVILSRATGACSKRFAARIVCFTWCCWYFLVFLSLEADCGELSS